MVNYGLDMLADYAARGENAKPKAKPAYITARKAEAAAKTALTKAETGLAELLANPTIPAAAKNSALIPRALKKITACQQKLEAAEAERKKHPAKLPANEIDPAATRAILHINRRCLQLNLRLLAANAEHYLARHLNAYLDDDDEYRAITRETIIRGLGGTITYTPRNVTVTLDRPASPASPAPSPCSSPRSTHARPSCPATAAHHLHAITVIALSRPLTAGGL